MGIAQELAELGIKIVVFEEQKEYIHWSDNIFAKDKNSTFKSIDEDNVQVISCLDSRNFLEEIVEIVGVRYEGHFCCKLFS